MIFRDRPVSTIWPPVLPPTAVPTPDPPRIRVVPTSRTTGTITLRYAPWNPYR